MKNFIAHFMIGMLTSFVPIFILSFYEGRMLKNDLDYAEFSRYAPWVMGLFHALVFTFWVELYEITDFFLISTVFTVIYSCYGAYGMNIPKDLFKLKNANDFHLMSLVLWGIIYGVFVDYIYKNLC